MFTALVVALLCPSAQAQELAKESLSWEDGLELATTPASEVLLQPGVYDVFTDMSLNPKGHGPELAGKIYVSSYTDSYGSHTEETWVLYGNYTAPDAANNAVTRIRAQTLAPVLNPTSHTEFLAGITLDCETNDNCDPDAVRVASWTDGREGVMAVATIPEVCESLDRQSSGVDCLDNEQIGDIPVLIIGGTNWGSISPKPASDPSFTTATVASYGYATVPAPALDSSTVDGFWWTEYWMVMQTAPVLGAADEVILMFSDMDGDVVYTDFTTHGSHGGIWDYGYEYLPGYAPPSTLSVETRSEALTRLQ